MRRIDLEKRQMWDDWDERWVDMPKDSIGIEVTQIREGGHRYCMPDTPLDKNMDIEDIKKTLGEETCKLWEIDLHSTEVVAIMIIDGVKWCRTIKYKTLSPASKELIENAK